MKKTFLQQFLFAVFLLYCIGAKATDELITEQRVVNVEQAGTLSSQISDADKYKITNLKITGAINGTDLRMIREMAGSDYQGEATSGKLATLDLSEAKIVSGGDWYYIYDDILYTNNNVLGDRAFDNCSSLTSIKIPSGVTSIGIYAFGNCSSLASVEIPSSVTSIGIWAFHDCSSLTSVVIPSSVTSIGLGAFDDCSSLTSVVIPSSVTFIGNSAFANCSSLASVVIPSGVISIGNCAFLDCSSLTSIDIPSSVTLIGNQAFFGCNSLTSIVIPSSVTLIGKQAFYGCSRLTSVVIPSSVTSIGYEAFGDCNSLTSIYVSWKTPISITADVFSWVDKQKCTLYVPQGTYKDYWLADGWCNFPNIVEYNATGVDNVTTSTDVREVARYSLNGQRLTAPTGGVNIVRYSDGSVKKVVVQ